MSNEEIVKQIQQGISPGDNMERLYNQNHGLISITARRYAFLDDVDDLLQEAYFGLYEAVKHYEDTAGVKFMSYAQFWIKQSITRYLENNGRNIRLPVAMHNQVIRYKKAISAFEMQLGRKPTDYELCRYLRIGSKALQSIKKATYRYDNIQSLDEPLPGNEDNDILLGDGLPDRSIDIENDVINGMIERSKQAELWEIVKENTTPEENVVIQARYIKSMSLEATGQLIGKSKDMARTIEAKALRKLRYPRVRRLLEEKFEVNYARAYRGSLNSFKSEWTSIVESIAMRNLEAEYKFR